MSNRQEWNTFGRAKLAWGTGPWQEEPDKVQWIDDHTGLPCLAVRHESNGHWCGYVGVPEGHRHHGQDYDAAHDANEAISVHGGLTYAAACRGAICHKVALGAPDNIWWLGFDCAHSEDISPGEYRIKIENHFGIPVSYKTLAYVEAQCAALASQLGAS